MDFKSFKKTFTRIYFNSKKLISFFEILHFENFFDIFIFVFVFILYKVTYLLLFVICDRNLNHKKYFWKIFEIFYLVKFII